MIFIFIRFKISVRECAMQIELSSRVIKKRRKPKQWREMHLSPCREMYELGFLWFGLMVIQYSTPLKQP